MNMITRMGGAVSFLLLLAAVSSEVTAHPQRSEDSAQPNTIEGRMAAIRQTLAVAHANLSANLAERPSQDVVDLLAQWGDWSDGNAWDDWSDWSDGWSDWNDSGSDWNDGNGWSDWNDGNGWSDWNDGWSDWSDWGDGWSDWSDY